MTLRTPEPVCRCDWDVFPWQCPALLPFPGESCIYPYYGFILTMNLFLWMHFRAWGWLLQWFHVSMRCWWPWMGQTGAVEHTPGSAGTPRSCSQIQLCQEQLEERELQADKVWEKDPGVHCRGNKAASTQHPFLCRNTQAFSSMDFHQRPSSPWEWMKQLLGNVAQSHLRCPLVGTGPAADDIVYLEYYSARSKASSNTHPPTILWFHEKPLKPDYQIPLN